MSLHEDDRPLGNRESQRGDEDVDRDNSTIIARRRRRRGNHDRVGERDDVSLFGIPTEDGNKNDAVGVRGPNRQAVLSSPRRNVRGTDSVTIQRA